MCYIYNIYYIEKGRNILKPVNIYEKREIYGNGKNIYPHCVKSSPTSGQTFFLKDIFDDFD